MAEILRGIFPVLQTAVRENGDVDPEGLEREVDFCARAGAHGVVFPVLGSEFQYLTETERQQLVEVVVKAADGRLPVVAGAAGTTQAHAVECARHAASVGADAVIALPPYLAGANREEIRAYYGAVSEAAQRPVFIQHSQAGMDPGFLSEMLNEMEWVQYVKEEQPPSAHNISGVLAGVGDQCRGVFGGGHSRWMMSELERGAAGFMPAAEATDVHVQIWDAWESGDRAAARALYNQLLPLINQILLLGLPLCKEILVRRGVFTSAAMRTPGSGQLDDGDRRELDAVLADLQPLFRV
ncbi:dihydrodipicolinate synthase family protein [Candidatus Latescibacterota bacterium]